MTSHLVVTGGVLLGYAVMVMATVPTAMMRRRWTSRAPRAAITIWIGALGSGGLAMVASMVCVVVAANIMAQRHGTTLTLDHAVRGAGLTLLACAVTATGGGLACLVIYRIVLSGINRRTLVTQAIRRPRSVPWGKPTPATIVRSDSATAISLPGRRPRIVISSRLADTLTPPQLEAVIEHERGHLLQHHHLLVQLADLQYKCAPSSAAPDHSKAPYTFSLSLPPMTTPRAAAAETSLPPRCGHSETPPATPASNCAPDGSSSPQEPATSRLPKPMPWIELMPPRPGGTSQAIANAPMAAWSSLPVPTI